MTNTTPQKTKTILVTGGAGFIGSHFVEKALAEGHRVVVLDALNYAGNPENLRQARLKYPSRYAFIQGSINDKKDDLVQILRDNHIDAVVNLAAQTHADASIEDPRPFVETNIGGTLNLLQATLEYWKGLPAEEQKTFRFLQASSDEVFGSLDIGAPPFSEQTQINQRNPYSATKAGADHLAYSFFNTYKLPIIITNSGNNYGPRQHPEKLIAGTITKGLNNQHYTVHGDGHNIRDWLHVEDNCDGLLLALENGKPGERYCLGGKCELTNLAVVRKIGALLQELCESGRNPPRKDRKPYNDDSLIDFVEDRPGNDERYAIDIRKAQRDLGFNPKYVSEEGFNRGLREAVYYYIGQQQLQSRGR